MFVKCVIRRRRLCNERYACACGLYMRMHGHCFQFISIARASTHTRTHIRACIFFLYRLARQIILLNMCVCVLRGRWNVLSTGAGTTTTTTTAAVAANTRARIPPVFFIVGTHTGGGVQTVVVNCIVRLGTLGYRCRMCAMWKISIQMNAIIEPQQ